MVLTHLILNGMIKVNGQLEKFVKGLEDPDHGIADLTKLLFTELSTKENAIYNNSVSLVHIMRLLTHVLQSSATCQSANIPMTRRRSRTQQDISSRSSKRFVPDTSSTCH